MIDHIWNEIQIRISFDSNWQKAKEILLEIINKENIKLSTSKKKNIQKKYRELTEKYPRLEPAVYVKAVDDGVQLTLRYICDTRNRRVTSQEIWEAVLKEFLKHKDINLR